MSQPAAAPQRPARAPARSARSSWLTDWTGIIVVFILWLGLLVLTVHNVVIPHTSLQRWPAWLPLLGGIRSTSGTGDPAFTEAAFTLPQGEPGLALGLVALAATPLLLSFGAALIAKWQQSPRARQRFAPEREKDTPQWTERERAWKRESAERICHLWVLEAKRSLQAQHRMTQHACLFGFAVSAVVSWSVILNNSPSISVQVRMMAVAAAAAAVTSFVLSFGRISVRASIRDASARMFAHALRAVITSVLAVLLLSTLLWHNHAASEAGKDGKDHRDHAVLSEQPLKNPSSFLMMGLLIALIGESVLGQLTTRAASAMNLTAPRTSESGPGLSSIEGLSEHDILRLGEEGIDSLHALAMASTAYLYFSTPYTLQRLCDWQDQALLITNVGFAKAQSCREKLMIRGCIDLQRKADFLISAARPRRPRSDGAQATGCRCECAAKAAPPAGSASGSSSGSGSGSDSSKKTEADDLSAENEKIFEIIRSSLGFISIEQARESLFPLAHDETVRRLRIYERGSVVEESLLET